MIVSSIDNCQAGRRLGIPEIALPMWQENIGRNERAKPTMKRTAENTAGARCETLL